MHIIIMSLELNPKLNIQMKLFMETVVHGQRPGAEFGGDQKNFSRPNFRKNFHFQGKFSDDLFLVIHLVLWIFPFFSHIFRIFTMLNVVYDHFLTIKTPFSTLLILSRTSDNTTTQKIGEDQCMGRLPPLKFWGTIPPRSPPLDTCTFCLLVAATENCAIEN